MNPGPEDGALAAAAPGHLLHLLEAMNRLHACHEEETVVEALWREGRALLGVTGMTALTLMPDGRSVTGCRVHGQDPDQPGLPGPCLLPGSLLGETWAASFLPSAPQEGLPSSRRLGFRCGLQGVRSLAVLAWLPPGAGWDRARAGCFWLLCNHASVAIANATLVRTAHEAAQVRAGFLTTMSHELRTPLHAIIGFTEVLRRGDIGPVSDRQDEAYGKLLGHAQAVLDCLERTLEASRPRDVA